MAYTPKTWTAAVPSSTDFDDVTDQVNQTSAGVATTAGDIVYATAAKTLARLPAGSYNQLLTVSTDNDPTWTAGADGIITKIGHTLLDDTTPSEATTWIDWGGNLDVGDPGVGTAIALVWFAGYVWQDGGGNATTWKFRVQASPNNGASWTNVTAEVPIRKKDSLQRPVWLAGAYAGTPTDNLLFRGQVFPEDTGPTCYNGQIAAVVIDV